jgi:hypothetical protein
MALTLPTIVPTKYAGTAADFLKAPGVRDGNVTIVAGAVTVPSGTAATSIVGLVPATKGARFVLSDKSIHCGNFGAVTTTVSVGFIYYDSDDGTSDADAWASASTAPQSGGFVTIDEVEGLTLQAGGPGWLAVTINTAAADAEAAITYQVGVHYGS